MHWKNIQTDDRFPRLQQGLQLLALTWHGCVMMCDGSCCHFAYAALRVEFGLMISNDWTLGGIGGLNLRGCEDLAG